MSAERPWNVIGLDGQQVTAEDALTRGPKPPDNGDMEARLAKVEMQMEKANEKLAGIDVRLATIDAKLDNTATKADVQSVKTAVAEGQNSIIKWVVGAIILVQVVPQIPALFKALLTLK